MSKISFCVLLLIIQYAIGSEVIHFQTCEESDSSICEIKEVRVEPCKEAKNGRDKPCKFKSGKNASIEFDYIANFQAENLTSVAYSAALNLPMPGMDRDACKFTDCPTKPGVQVTYKNLFYMDPLFPRLGYTVKWRLWDSADNTKAKGCCFTFRITIS